MVAYESRAGTDARLSGRTDRGPHREHDVTFQGKKLHYCDDRD